VLVAQFQIACDHLAAEVAGRLQASGLRHLLDMLGDFAQAELLDQQRVEAHHRDRPVGADAHRRRPLARGQRR
jgi:hypothetical protein